MRIDFGVLGSVPRNPQEVVRGSLRLVLCHSMVLGQTVLSLQRASLILVHQSTPRRGLQEALAGGLRSSCPHRCVRFSGWFAR